LIIGGIEVFLPSNPVEDRACVVDATTEERQPTMTVMMKEQISEVSQGKEEEHIVEILTQWEIELSMLENWLDNLKPTDGFQETVMQISGEEHSTELLKIFIQEA
jgi:hypothetical protein